jgi:hypothetical protein
MAADSAFPPPPLPPPPFPHSMHLYANFFFFFASDPRSTIVATIMYALFSRGVTVAAKTSTLQPT